MMICFAMSDFWRFLLAIDRDFAENAREKGCSCGGHLHAANYFRKPRGGPDDLPKECCLRLSFCCDREGCRKRLTPPSVRFLGPKVYLLPVIFLAAAMRQGPSPRAMRELSALFGADRRTIARWQVFWREHFPQTRSGRSRGLGSCRRSTSPLLPLSLAGGVLHQRRPAGRLGAAAAFSLTDHDRRGPGDRGLAMISIRPQKMLVEHLGGGK